VQKHQCRAIAVELDVPQPCALGSHLDLLHHFSCQRIITETLILDTAASGAWTHLPGCGNVKAGHGSHRPILDSGPGPPAIQNLRRHVGEQTNRQSNRADR
jgi:hypothetical protein